MTVLLVIVRPVTALPSEPLMVIPVLTETDPALLIVPLKANGPMPVNVRFPVPPMLPASVIRLLEAFVTVTDGTFTVMSPVPIDRLGDPFWNEKAPFQICALFASESRLAVALA